MSEIKLILIHGLAGHEKDTVAKMAVERLLEEHNFGGVLRISQADPLKRAASEMLGIPLKELPQSEQAYSLPIRDFTREQKKQEIDVLGITLGKYMQILGQGIIDHNFR